MRRLWRSYNLSIVLGVMFLASWVGQLVTQWFDWANEQTDHDQPLEIGAFPVGLLGEDAGKLAVGVPAAA